MKPKAVTLLSGGLDSSVATYLAQKDFDIALALTFDYGQKAARREIDAARRICERLDIRHETIAIPWLGAVTKTALVNPDTPIPGTTPETLDSDARSRASAVWVPNRNGVFISIAAAYAEASGCNAVVAGFNAEEAKTFPDNSAGFVEAANRALALSTLNSVKVVSPTLNMAKPEIARALVKSEIDRGLIWCCYDGGEKPCGKCESCARMRQAFAQIGGI